MRKRRTPGPPPGAQATASRLERAAASDRSLLSSSSLTFASRAYAKAAQVLFLVAAARFLTVDEFAAYSYILVLAAAFAILSDTGVPLVSSRDISASGSAGDPFWAAAPIVVVSAVLAAGLMCVLGWVDSGSGSTAGPVLLAAGFVLANRAFDFFGTTLRALGRFGFEAAILAIGTTGFIIGGIAATAAGLGVSAVVAVLLLKELLSALVAYAALRHDVGPPRLRGGVDWRPLLRAGISLSLGGTALAIVMRLPLGVLANSGSAHDVAVFSAAQRFGDGAILLTTTAGFALLPGMSYLAATEPARVRMLLWRTVAALTGVSAVVALAALPFAGTAMGIAFGDEFRSGAAPLRIMLAGFPAYAVLGVCWYAIVALHAERSALWVGVGGLLVSVGMSFALIPATGAVGAAWAYVCALAAMAAASAFVVIRQLSSDRKPYGAPSAVLADPRSAAAPPG